MEQQPIYWKKISIAVVLIGVVVLSAILLKGFGGYLFGKKSEEKISAQPEGLLVMSIADNSSEGTIGIIPTLYNFSTREFAYMAADTFPQTPGKDDLAYQFSVSPNGAHAVFVGSPTFGSELLASGSSFGELPLYIYRTTLPSGGTLDEVTERIQQATQITTDEGTFKQFPSVADTGAVLYTSHPLMSFNDMVSSEANEWAIHHVSVNGMDEIVTQGVQPTWISNDTFVYLKTDGLYLYSMTERTERQLLALASTGDETETDEAPLTVRNTASLDVSPKGELLVWSIPEANAVNVFRVDSWRAGDLTLLHTIPVPAITATLSPDGTLLAVESWVGDGINEAFVNLNIFDAVTGEAVGQPLEVYDVVPFLTYVTEWLP